MKIRTELLLAAKNKKCYRCDRKWFHFHEMYPRIGEEL